MSLSGIFIRFVLSAIKSNGQVIKITHVLCGHPSKSAIAQALLLKEKEEHKKSQQKIRNTLDIYDQNSLLHYPIYQFRQLFLFHQYGARPIHLMSINPLKFCSIKIAIKIQTNSV